MKILISPLQIPEETMKKLLLLLFTNSLLIAMEHTQLENSAKINQSRIQTFQDLQQRYRDTAQVSAFVETPHFEYVLMGLKETPDTKKYRGFRTETIIHHEIDNNENYLALATKILLSLEETWLHDKMPNQHLHAAAFSFFKQMHKAHPPKTKQEKSKLIRTARDSYEAWGEHNDGKPIKPRHRTLFAYEHLNPHPKRTRGGTIY
jgi:hypothetical protein